ncbi:S-adenosyl-L-methionine-dependent methyltransferase [Hesseltinella vesiculosa]|uniref:S-adenosyl-L-methionine-dependent methyltransferase n=1 Tax=Hesseltinella vesiculosa TaxID=101127 RepID=A0A1X2GM70_9FUNG|nr:S-adenosyl-L-methionine-dependent methyltransferase [Hesseltinella vesiculosa]
MAINDDDNLQELEGLADQLDDKSPSFDINQLPKSFQTFLKDNAIDPQIYSIVRLPRYIRWNTHIPEPQLPTLAQLKQQLHTDDVWQVPGLTGFFGIGPTSTRLVDIPAYKDKKVFGIDLSSAVAVEALEIDKDDHLLDVCCAPGAKLCMMANLLGHQGTGTATGVDIAAHRLATCRSLIRKYKIGQRIRLYEADATTFSLTAPLRLGAKTLSKKGDSPPADDHSDSRNTDDQPPPAKKPKTEQAVQKPFWASRLLRTSGNDPVRLYDKVLVDAECTHDGSISHILKYEKWGWDAFESNFMDTHRLNTICELQRNLMKQGWAMLRTGGIMVYSTCSLTIKQNEENVAWFLTEHPEAHLEPVPLSSQLGIRLAEIKKVQTTGAIQDLMNQHCVRFDPLLSNTSGFFLAKFTKSAK